MYHCAEGLLRMKFLPKEIQIQPSTWEGALTAENSCKLAGCRQRGLQGEKRKKERKSTKALTTASPEALT